MNLFGLVSSGLVALMMDWSGESVCEDDVFTTQGRIANNMAQTGIWIRHCLFQELPENNRKMEWGGLAHEESSGWILTTLCLWPQDI